VTFEVRVDKLGRVKTASIASPAGLSSAMTKCLRDRMMWSTFLPGDGEARGFLRVP
jgi:hypothetical protein